MAKEISRPIDHGERPKGGYSAEVIRGVVWECHRQGLAKGQVLDRCLRIGMDEADVPFIDAAYEDHERANGRANPFIDDPETAEGVRAVMARVKSIESGGTARSDD